MFLTPDELERLTGHKQKAAQRRNLKMRHIPYEENAIGELLVSRSYIERRLSDERVESAANDGPNLGFLKDYGKAKRHPKPGLLAS